MALSAATVLEVRLGGGDTNGGGFVTGASGTDHSLQDAAQYAVADGVTAGTTTITSATANFGTDVVGNIMYVAGGTGSVVAGWYQIISRSNAATIVVDRSTGLTAGTGVTLNIGGALKSPGMAGAIATVAGMRTFIKYNASPYVATSASTNIAEGCVSGTSNTAYCGYDSTRSLYNSDANRPTFQTNTGVSTARLMAGTNNAYSVQNMILDCNGQTAGICGFQSGEWFCVKAMGGLSGGLHQNSATAGRTILCEITTCGAIPVGVTSNWFSVAHNNTGINANCGAFNLINGSAGFCYGCVAYGNDRSGFSTGSGYVNCVAYDNTEYGFTTHNNGMGLMMNCIAEGNTLAGYRINTGSQTLYNCADYNNSTRHTITGGTVFGDVNPITLTGSPFTNAATGDFTINNTAGAGADCRAVGFPAAFPPPISGTTNFRDIGAAQHQDGGRMLRHPGMSGGMNG